MHNSATLCLDLSKRFSVTFRAERRAVCQVAPIRIALSKHFDNAQLRQLVGLRISNDIKLIEHPILEFCSPGPPPISLVTMSGHPSYANGVGRAAFDHLGSDFP